MNRAIGRCGAVPIPPAAQLAALGATRLDQPLVLAAREFARQADPAIQHAARGAESDHYLLIGSTTRAIEALQTDPRRRALLQLLQTDAPQPEALATLRALMDSDDPVDAAISTVFIAWLEPGELTRERVRRAQALIRPVGGANAVARLSLVGSLAYSAVGLPGLALTEALRCEAQGHAGGDSLLLQHAEQRIADLRGSAQDDRVRQLIEVTLSLRVQDPAALFERVAQATLALVTDAQRAFVLVGPHDALEVRGSAFAKGFAGSPSLAIASSTVLQGREVITREVQEVAQSESIEAMDLRTVLCIPLGDGERPLGAIYADSRTATDQALQQVAWLVRAFAAYATVVLQNNALLAEANRRTLHAREVAHDLRNVASGMRLGLDELDDFDLPDDAKATLADLHAMNRVLLASLEALLDQRQERHGPLDLERVVLDSVNLLRFQARARQVEIQVRTTPLQVRGARDELSRVVANLVGNALKYSEPGQQIRIELGERNGRALIIVADEGPGIPEHQLGTIFQSGVQADGARSGHGLGLGICATIVAAHGGILHARNRTKKGSAFTVALPLA